MTDTVNVPREIMNVPREMFDTVLDAASEYAVDHYGNSYGLNHPIDRERIWNILAAPPKSEPVSDPYKLDLSAVIRWLENGCDTEHAIAELKIYQERLARQPLSNPQQLPEAQKGEPVAVPEELWSWLVERGLDPDEPDFDWRDIVENLNEHENELIHPAPSSELLEALKPFADAAEDLDDGETGHIWERPAAMSIDASDLRRAYEIYAKHKGPQS